MAKFICEFEGVYGRTLKLYDTKIVIVTKITAGSIATTNSSDGEKTLFLKDIVGVQFKKSGARIGYLQFETPSMQMNNNNDNYFSENTFTFRAGKNGITNILMEKVYSYIVDKIEEVKYNTTIVTHIPDFESIKDHGNQSFDVTIDDVKADINLPLEIGYDNDGYIDIICPKCGKTISLLQGENNVSCPWCNMEINIK
ncbi:MAG: hypothetical protein E7536_05860 [Ruminococcaceae bacterium]|nr:hypothetical protein [Oscillospiraceae bacterium]